MDKSPDAFRTISEVADEIDLPQHVLRFWETRFGQIRPLKRAGGRRYYRPEDVDLLRGIRHLLYGEGYTIKGVQRILKAEGIRFVQAVGRGEQAVGPEPRQPGDEGDDAPEPVPPQRDAAPARAEPDEPLPRDMLGALALSANEVDRLRDALDDLVECERLLAGLRADAAGADPTADLDEP
ncbi:MerR family transcriptional regulator [Salinarimonas soli]|uniref:MerR family transcriptional regulator n=1 Tax=Salinarimonas soli TaxID=1638099 RepID=A0A5B2VDU9_9HYPH|nr:MerR family transcriptional regulator [Salinarimonas soli]KAA2237271.1 MerR family transcriptional regulator [Salinarimonas soli]